MSDVVTPPWIAAAKPSPPPSGDVPKPVGNPSWYRGMRSPHPPGRPKGSNPQTKLMQRMLADADGILDAILARALSGDVGAASLILNRIVPTLKAQAEKIQINFDATAPAGQQVEAVLEAIASGVIAADVGKQLIDAIGALSQVRANEELEARIAALEDKQL